MKLNLIANAKLNLGLNILEKLPNGYHSLDMLMVPISLADKLEVEFLDRPGNLKITCNKKDIPTDERNILYKIYNEFYKKINLHNQEIKVHLIKNIPHEAGLGGGSSDGGVFLNALNEYHKNKLSYEELVELSKKIGADIPFFITNKPARAKGIGEKLDFFKNNLNCSVILIKPTFGVSAKEAYLNYSKITNKKDAKIEKILTGLKENKLSSVISNIENHLEQGLELTNENIINFKNVLEKLQGYKFFMTGSGSTYFTIIDSCQEEEAYDILKDCFKDYEVYLCKFL